MPDTSPTPTRLHVTLEPAERLGKGKLPAKARKAVLLDPALPEIVKHGSEDLLTTTTDSIDKDAFTNH